MKNSKLCKLLLSHFKIEDLYGKSIKDKRGGKNNIHSWDIELKGMVSKNQRDLVIKGYLKRKYLKKKVKNIRIQDDNLPLGYNIAAGNRELGKRDF